MTTKTKRFNIFDWLKEITLKKSEWSSFTEEQKDDNSLEVTLSPWIILSADKEIVVPTDWVVSIVEPLESVVQMYQEKVNGRESN